MTSIDLNADVGELPELIADGTQEQVMRAVSSVNVACGGHAGDEDTIKTTLEMAKKLGLGVGAHPSYPDRRGFGRVPMKLSPAELSRSIGEQLQCLAELARGAGVVLTHVKPHGALYNGAADEEPVAQAICESVLKFDRKLLVIGLGSSKLIDIARHAGLATASEAFVDRRYEKTGRLRSRSESDALIVDPSEAVQQALSIVRDSRVRARNGGWIPISAQTLCIHGDTPGAELLARAVSDGLKSAGVEVRKL